MVAGDEETTKVVTVIWLTTPSEVVGTTWVASTVLEENSTEVDVDVRVVGEKLPGTFC